MPVPSPDLRALVLIVLLLAAGPLAAAEAGSAGRPGMDVGAVLGGAASTGFRVADRPRAFRFPADHGAHPAFRSEWWYLTAHLEDPAGRAFGLQFTLFRQALAPPRAVPMEEASRWRTEQVWMAHLALTSEQDGHRVAERFARGALELAGVRSAPFAAWLDDWRLESSALPGAASAAGTGGLFPLRLSASVPPSETRPAGEGFAVDLQLTTAKPPVLQGEDGLSRKSDRAGNASYYYSLTRLPASGELRIGDRRFRVTGLGWLDREWSTSALDPGQTGWDWFALHLDDGRDLMLYRIRRADGSVDAASAGVLVARDGTRTTLTPEDWRLEVIETWADGEGGAWPVAWRLALPGHGIDGVVRAVTEDALNRVSVRYWEGMVDLEPSSGSAPAGRGYLELTGYAAP
ncbi:MAG: lipocalin-like domain-containing protein [Pseudomonadales bacterium]|jgi:predicted secreted hydrolase|nr:lipocalin-like domain-containing protein [Pseudomonadales bacterium]